MSDKKQILSALPGFEPLTSEPKDTIGFRTVSRRNYDPPDYVVAFLFLEILKYRNFGPSDKIRWHTYFLFKDHTFLLRDFKFDVWELEAREEGAFGGKILSEVLARIKAAARYAGRILEKELRKRIDKEDFWINNGYPALRAAFDFYLTEARRAEEARKSWENAEPRRFNEGQHLDRALGYRALPLMVSFFSLLEFLLDAFFAFERPGLGFLEFRRLPWREGFKMVIALPPSSDILRIYEQIVRIRDDFRNPLIHGFNNESGLLLSVPFGGLVPASFEHLDNAIRFGLDSPFPPSSVGEIVSSFAALFDLLKKIEPYTYYVRYLEYDFAVPMLKSEIAAIRSEMTSPEDFEHYLRLKSEYQYAILNREL